MSEKLTMTESWYETPDGHYIRCRWVAGVFSEKTFVPRHKVPFVVAPPTVCWSSISAPTSWDTPNASQDP